MSVALRSVPPYHGFMNKALTNVRNARPRSPERVFSAMDHIDAHLDEPLTLEDLAARVGLSPWHFHRLFRLNTGEPVHRFIQRLRMEKGARELLLSPGRSVTDIALDCGFASPSTFARAFRTHFGMNARQWRRAPVLNPLCDEARHSLQCTQTDIRKWSIDIAGIHLDVALCHYPPVHLAYTRAMGSYRSPEIFSDLLRNLTEAICLSPKTPEIPVAYTIFHDHPGITPSQRCRISMGIPVRHREDHAIPGLNTLSIPACWQISCTLLFSRHSHWGAPLKTLAAHWLPRMGFLMSRFPPHILISPPAPGAPPRDQIEIRIPVVPQPGFEYRSLCS